MSMCMRCGQRKSPRRGEAGCDCARRKEDCIAAGRHGVDVRERPDAIFPGFVHRTCLACGGSVKEQEPSR